eukprot:1140933-Pelagomonas_calceolata.AAC.13
MARQAALSVQESKDAYLALRAWRGLTPWCSHLHLDVAAVQLAAVQLVGCLLGLRPVLKLHVRKAARFACLPVVRCAGGGGSTSKRRMAVNGLYIEGGSGSADDARRPR